MELRDKKTRRAKRKALLKKLLKQILGGEFDCTPIPLDTLYQNDSVRKQYISPRDRSTTNYGFMNVNEIGAGTPITWK